MKKKHFVFVLALVFLFSCKQEKETMTIAFYNVENLFDTIDDPNKKDEEFTPEGRKKWDQKRYEKKLNDLAKVLSSIDSVKLPAIIGLCEIENRKVVEDLIQTGKLAKAKYKVAHIESPDVRGIDVALAYQNKQFKFVSQEAIPINFEDAPDYKTRDILHVSGRLKGEDTHIFVNHWPSRIGGLEQSEPRRTFVASVLKNKVDEIIAENPSANIIIMGDMNDEPDNKSLLETLSAKLPGSNSGLANLMFPLDQQNKGTYNYRNTWNMLDNLVVSKSMLDEKGLDVVGKEGHIFRKEWMEFKNSKGEIYPNRTYGGPNYYGGISDHFPVYFQLQVN